MTNLVSSALIYVGAILVAVAATLVEPVAGVATAGVLLIALGAVEAVGAGGAASDPGGLE